MTLIRFNAELIEINNWKIIHLPLEVSNKLPSRGMVMIEASINTLNMALPLEPDGMGSHWFRVSDDLCEALGIQEGDVLELFIKPLDIWAEPEVPEDLSLSIKACRVEIQWNSITTKARWEWIRWIRSTANPKTRQKRIATACSMLESGKKRPCCFDHSRCTETHVSQNGILYNHILPKPRLGSTDFH